MATPTSSAAPRSAPGMLGVIPARGGSKGIPKKNIRSVAGRPLLSYTIAAARESKLLTAFLVSTDSDEIAEIAEAEGAPVPFRRPAELATDEAATTSVLRHAVEFYELDHPRLHSVVTLQPTTPLRTSEDIDAAIERYLKCQPDADSLVSVCEAGQMHPLTLYRQTGDYLAPLLPDQIQTTRRQEFERILWRNGAVYITRRDLLLEGAVVGPRPAFHEMPRERSINIDDEFDLDLAEWLLSGAGDQRGNE